MSRYIHDLSEREFKQLLESKPSKKRSLVAQKNFELYVIEQSWKLTDKYNYKGVSSPVALVCPNDHECNIRPDNFKNGRRCKKCSGKCPEQARQDFERLIARSNWKLSSTYCYQTTKKKVNVICDKGHEIRISPEKFKSGVRCSKCSSNNVENAIQDFDDRIKACGWHKSEIYRYVTSQTKVDLICENGHSVKITPSDFKQGKGCSICAGNSKDFARRLFENTVLATRWKFSEGYEYQSATKTVSLECPNGHSKTIAPNQFRISQYCKACDFNLSEVGKERFNLELDIKGWVLAPNASYQGANELIALICNNDHLVKRTPADIYRGRGCPTCSRKDRTDNISESFIDIVYHRGWQLAPDYVYVNSGEKVSLICDEGHNIHVLPDNFKAGFGLMPFT